MIPVAQTGTKFANIGKITITPSKEIRMELVDTVTAQDGGAASDADMKDLIAKIKSQYEASLKTVKHGMLT